MTAPTDGLYEECPKERPRDVRKHAGASFQRKSAALEYRKFANWCRVRGEIRRSPTAALTLNDFTSRVASARVGPDDAPVLSIATGEPRDMSRSTRSPPTTSRSGSGVNYYIETKNPEAAPGMEEELLRLMDEYGLRGPAAERWQVLIQSFSPASLQKIHALDPSLPLTSSTTRRPAR